MADDYEAFLRRKDMLAAPTGIPEAEVTSPHLFPFQRDLTRWLLRRGRGACFADTGLGKGRMLETWADAVATHTGGRVLILAPLAVASTVLVPEGERIGIAVKYARKQADASRITVANYDMLEHFDPREFAGVALDECFPVGTKIDVIENAVRTQKNIENVRVGDRILNAIGVDVVADVHRREVPYAVRVSANGRSIVSSPNHPFFTQRGWVCAQDIEPGDSLMESRTAMRMVREGVPAQVQDAERWSILRDILLSEVAHAATGSAGKGTCARGGCKAGPIAIGMAQVRSAWSIEGTGTNHGAQPDYSTGSEGEDLPPVEGDAPRTFRAWGQRSWFDAASEDSSGCTRTELETGICLVTGPTDSRLSDALQTRLGAARTASVHRSGWSLAQGDLSQRDGCEEGHEARFTRVDRLEVLEQGNPELERLRSPDGKLYFYDIGATRHPSFSVDGVLVHNSSILKDFTSSTRNALIDAFAGTPFRACFTATPSPNDFTELGNHAEFLGIMRRVEMLAMFFTHDGGSTQDWTIKAHGREAFWRWVCSWAALIKRPSDLGYDDTGYDLPPIDMRQHVVRATTEQARQQGKLFAEAAHGLTEQRGARKATLADRVDMCTVAVCAEPQEPWIVWCELNDESAALAKAIPGAVEVRGSMSPEAKEEALRGFSTGKIRVLITKPSVAGMGMNWQHCARIAYVGVSHSFEQWYQSIRRCWRFGQKRQVICHIITSELEGEVLTNLRRKEADAATLAEEMRRYTAAIVNENVRGAVRETDEYAPSVEMTVPAWLKTEAA